MFKVGDKVESYKADRELSHYKDFVGKIFTIKLIEKDAGNSNEYAVLEETAVILPYLFNLRLLDRFSGVTLLEQIKKEEIKNCDIKVYKNNKYQFTVECGEKGILSNPRLHVGMLTSDKYTYEPI